MKNKKLWILFSSLVVALSACNSTEDGSVVQSESSAIVDGGTTLPAPTPATPPPATPAPPPITTAKNVALIYDGDGACVEDCAKAAADTAALAGFTTKIVGPSALTSTSTATQISELFKDAAIWVQPGGYATQAYEAMSPTLRTALKNFVNNGGGYVGFCAGAFMATNYIGSTGVKGLGIFPGSTTPLGTNSLLETVKWEGKTRQIYFEGGPYMYNIPSLAAETMAVYDDGKTIAAARAAYGKGRVYLAGPHPEAPDWWGSLGSDGSDRDLAINMMKWAAKKI